MHDESGEQAVDTFFIRQQGSNRDLRQALHERRSELELIVGYEVFNDGRDHSRSLERDVARGVRSISRIAILPISFIRSWGHMRTVQQT